MIDKGKAMSPEDRVAALQVEFARLVERQGTLHRLLEGGDLDLWLSTKRIGARDYTLVIDTAVGEARQGATAMATIAKTLDALESDAPAIPVEDPLQKMREERAARKAQQKPTNAIVEA